MIIVIFWQIGQFVRDVTFGPAELVLDKNIINGVSFR
jgi:hypothetical protein